MENWQGKRILYPSCNVTLMGVNDYPFFLTNDLVVCGRAARLSYLLSDEVSIPVKSRNCMKYSRSLIDAAVVNFGAIILVIAYST